MKGITIITRLHIRNIMIAFIDQNGNHITLHSLKFPKHDLQFFFCYTKKKETLMPTLKYGYPFKKEELKK